MPNGHAIWSPLLSSLIVLHCGCELPVLAGKIPDKYVEVPLSHNDKVDVLFVVDNSSSMSAKQDRLILGISALVHELGVHGSYHFGAVSSDLGAGTSTAMPAGCRPGGDAALLYAVGAGASADHAPTLECPGTTDRSPFVVEDFTLGSNNRGGQSLLAALRCMLLAGTGGCPIQQPLEAARLALSLSGDRNDRFLRPEALLVVIYLTDGDDCSLPAGSHLFDSPASAEDGPLSSFRCTRFGIEYGFPPVQVPGAATVGPLAQAAPMGFQTAGLPGRLRDVNDYRDELRGLKSDPNDVVVLAIAGPPEPFEIIGAEAGSEKTAAPRECAGLDGQTCLPALKHSCSASGAPELFGSPAVRLRAVVQSMKHHYESPVCSNDQLPALRDFGAMVVAQRTKPGCVAVSPSDGKCEVRDAALGGRGPDQWIPECGTDGSTPCWKLVSDPSCPPVGGATGGNIAQFRVDIDRGGKAAPPGTIAHARCAMPAS